MKKLLTLVVLAVIALGGGAAVARHYENYQTNKNAEDAKVAAAVLDVENQRRAQAEAREAELKALYNELRIECEKGRAAYDRLTAYQRQQTEVPSCGAVLL